MCQEISRFRGIIVRMFYEMGRHQHPHFHAVYGESMATFMIDPPALLAGPMPRKQLHLIITWAELHQEELIENWELAKKELQLRTIEGL